MTVTESPAACPSCRATAFQLLGRIPDANEFAGRLLPDTLPGGSLYVCDLCGLWFRYPLLPETLLKALYADAPGESWDIPDDERVDWQLAVQAIGKAQGNAKVLDIGCHDGRFLSSVSAGWERYGIEMGQVAAIRAQANGATIIGSEANDLDGFPNTFQVITAFDLFEHVADPLQLLRNVASALVPGGKAVIATGNTQSLPFRLLKGKYAYCVCAEHLAFLSPNWVKWASGQVGLNVEKVILYRRSAGTVRSKVTDAIKGFGFRLTPALFKLLRQIGVGRTTDQSRFGHAPLWPTATDHFLVILRKTLT